MYIKTKYIVEFYKDKETEIFCLCDSTSCVKEYLKEKFNIQNVEIRESGCYLATIPIEFGAIRVRKIDVVQDEEE